MQGVRLKLLFGLIGAVLGCALGSLPGALAMALLGALGGWWWGTRSAAARSESSTIDMPTLVRRVAVLEHELGRLRQQVDGLLPSQPAPVVTRFLTYDVKLNRACIEYSRTIMAMPEMVEWIAAAKLEPDDIEELDMDF